MFRRRFCNYEPTVDLRELRRPGAYREECKLLLTKLLNFVNTEALHISEAEDYAVEKQDVSYKLLEEENFTLRTKVFCLQKLKELEDVQSSVQSEKPNPSLDSKVVKENEGCLTETGEVSFSDNRSEKLSFRRDGFESLDILCQGDSTSAIVEQDIFEPRQAAEQSIYPNTEESNGDSYMKMKKLEDENKAVNSDNIVLQEKISHLTIDLGQVKLIVENQKLRIDQTEEVITLLRKEKFNLLQSVHNMEKSLEEASVKNETQKQQLLELEEYAKMLKEKNEKRQRPEPDYVEERVLDCYKKRLYDAFREVESRDDLVKQLTDSMENLIEKFNKEKSLYIEEQSFVAQSADGKTKKLLEDKLKLEETVRQQGKLIDHLQSLIKSKEKTTFC